MTRNDMDKFWAADEIAHKDNCFSKEATQVAMGIRMSGECVFAELEEAGAPWGFTPRDRKIELHKRYNDKAEKIVGKRLLPESFPAPGTGMSGLVQIGTLFGGTYTNSDNGTWLHSPIKTEAALEAQLDKIDKMDFRTAVLPADWEQQKKRIFEEHGNKPNQFFSIRGPVTLATSIFGTEQLIFLHYDAPELFKRFSDTILKVVLNYIDLMIEESGHTRDNFVHGFGFFDDDCNLMTPEMYEIFGYPVLRDVFNHVSFNEGDRRYQHSDSAMGHLLPFFEKVKLNGCNFGPTLTVTEIRNALPNCRIDGQLAPFTFMNNDPAQIAAEVKRDCEMAKIGNKRGVNISTAGSINNGSSLQSMLVVMETIMEHGQYVGVG